jgi:hypothetical protein
LSGCTQEGAHKTNLCQYIPEIIALGNHSRGLGGHIWVFLRKKLKRTPQEIIDMGWHNILVLALVPQEDISFI